jgi:hypothetical protein
MIFFDTDQVALCSLRRTIPLAAQGRQPSFEKDISPEKSVPVGRLYSVRAYGRFRLTPRITRTR